MVSGVQGLAGRVKWGVTRPAFEPPVLARGFYFLDENLEKKQPSARTWTLWDFGAKGTRSGRSALGTTM